MTKKTAKHKEDQPELQQSGAEQEELPPAWKPQPKPELEPKQQTAADIEEQQTTDKGPGKVEGMGKPELDLTPEMPTPEPQEGTTPPPEGADVS